MHHQNPHYHSFCPQCCHPVSSCCCEAPRCRKEPKELVITPKAAALPARIKEMFTNIREYSKAVTWLNLESFVGVNTGAKDVQIHVGTGNAFIGGGCCVHLSAEFMPENPVIETTGAVCVFVIDSTGVFMAWGQEVKPNTSYQIKENIITTNPGAKLFALAVNATMRVRWCEIFSC